MGNDPKKNLVLPGMTAQVNISTGNRSVLEYLLKPFYPAIDSIRQER